MNKKLLTLVLATSLSASFAQIELRKHNGTALINGTTITVLDTLENDNNQDVEVKIDVKSLYSTTKTLRVKKIELSSTAPLSTNAICWGTCTLGVIWGSSPIVISDPDNINASQTAIYSGHVYPKLDYGVTSFKYVFYDDANPTDSTWVNVNFNVVNVNGVGIEEVEKETSLKVFPNPATTFLNVKLNSNEENKKIEIIDLLGKKVFTKTVNNDNSNTTVDTSSLKAGIYFVSVTSNNKAIRTEKVVITK